MRNSLRLVLGLILISLLFSCAGSGAAGGGGGKISLKANMGDYLPRNINEQTDKVLKKHQYLIERQEDNGGDMYFETRWKERSPYEDEATEGVVGGRSRVIVTARPTQKVLNYTTGQRMFKTSIVIENQVKLKDSAHWEPFACSPKVMAQFKRISDDLKSELRFGAGN